MDLHVLDVGQGQSVLMQADGHYMLVDGGGREASSFVVSYLREQGIEKLDCAVVTHYDEDHMAGLIGVLSVISTDVFLVPDYAGNGDLYQSFAVAALSNGCMITLDGVDADLSRDDLITQGYEPCGNCKP